MLRAIAAAKKKNDTIDARKIADCLRCDLLPECHMCSTEIRDRRRTLRYRHLVIRQMVQMKNRVAGLLLEGGVSYDWPRFHHQGYFTALLANNEEISDSIRPRQYPAIAKAQQGTYPARATAGRCVDRFFGERSSSIGSVAAPQNHPGSGSDHGPHLGTGDRRLHAVSIGKGGHQLLRVVQRREELR
jgi:hypothetical protein